MTFDKKKWQAELETTATVYSEDSNKWIIRSDDALALLERAYAEGRADALRSEMNVHDLGDEDREAWRTGTEFFDNEDLTTYRCENYDRIAALLAAAQGGIK